MTIGRRLAPAALLYALLFGPAAAQGVVADLPLTTGGSERSLLLPAAQTRATVILLPGGDGIVRIGSDASVERGGNFLIRSRNSWAGRGFSALVLAPPNGMSLLGRRHGAEYLIALAAAADYARSRASVPVWLVGTSQGSIAAANGAAHLPGRIFGVVLTSSVTRASRSGETVFDADPGAIAVAALVVSNQYDTCVASPPADGNRLLAALARAPRREFIMVASNQLSGDPCEAYSPHGYLGIEDAVVQRIADWIGGGR